MELDSITVLWVSLIATVAVQVFRLVAARTGAMPSRRLITFVVMGVAILLAALLNGREIFAQLPGDPMDAASALIVWAGIISGVAKLIYDLLLDKIFKALGMGIPDIEPDPEPDTEPLPAG
jgi:predicted membrane channel-forming protein YqfA (hemolysin III family)